jgi:hypothetical protein
MRKTSAHFRSCLRIVNGRVIRVSHSWGPSNDHHSVKKESTSADLNVQYRVASTFPALWWQDKQVSRNQESIRRDPYYQRSAQQEHKTHAPLLRVCVHCAL